MGILEEPEHLNWVHHGGRWSDRFSHVIGIVHTNYRRYAEEDDQRDPLTSMLQPVFNCFFNVICYEYADINIKLSGTIPSLTRDVTVNVHGVRQHFIDKGLAFASETAAAPSKPRAYFLAKAVRAKGYGELFDLYKSAADLGVTLPGLNAFGSGKEEHEIRARAAEHGHPVNFHAGVDHASATLDKYAIFVNPSTSEVLCTATLEAVAMGKACVIADHVSNSFFKQFKHAFFYTPGDVDEFAAAWRNAEEFIEAGNLGLCQEDAAVLSWELAVERLFEAAAMPAGAPRGTSDPLSHFCTNLHWCLTGPQLGDVLRDVVGIGAEQDWRRQKTFLPRKLPKAFKPVRSSDSQRGGTFAF